MISSFYKFDNYKNLLIPSLGITVTSGEAIAILGTRGNDVTSIYNEFNTNNILKIAKNPSSPIIRCITTHGNLFYNYSAINNYKMTDRSILNCPLSKIKTLVDDIILYYKIPYDFEIPLKNLSPSAWVLVELVRLMVTKMDILVCDNLISLLDNQDRIIFKRIISDMRAKGKRIVYLTTKWEAAVQIADRIIITNNNTLLGQLPTPEVINDPTRLLNIISGNSYLPVADNDSSDDIMGRLYTAAEYLTSNYQLNDVLTLTARNITRLLNCHSSSIYIFAKKTEEFHNFDSSSEVSVLASNYLQSCLKSTSSNSVFYSTSDEKYYNSYFKTKAPITKSFLMVPVASRSNISGFVVAYFSNNIIYTKRHLQYLRSFSKELSIIIETSKLMGNSALLQESNHRIKNNLQIIISLISMQQLHFQEHPTENIDNAFDSIISSVQNIAALHNLLTSPENNENTVELQKIINCVSNTYSNESVKFTINSNDVMIPYGKATSLGMVLNELITNSIKYAFNSKQTHNHIQILSEYSSDYINIHYTDNGCGLPANIKFESANSVGFTIIKTIIRYELHGTLKYCSSPAGVTCFIQIPFFDN